MTRICRLFVFALAWISFAAIAPGSADAAAETRRALLIGINTYQTEEFSNLRGAVNDVEAMRRILVSKYGFPESNVEQLTDAAATRQAILNGFDKLIEQSSPGDIVYVHYSGHGSQVQDLNGDEEDRMDETILSHDARTENVPDITDDEIGRFLHRLQARRAVVVLDSCHSGTATRGSIATRSVAPDTRLDLYRAVGLEASTRSIVAADIPDRYVLLSGAASNQNALDGPIDGKFRGFFSYAFSEALREMPAAASPREIHRHVDQTYQHLSQKFGGLRLPDPQFEADENRLAAPLFAAERATDTNKAYLNVSLVDDGMARLLGASAQISGEGSVWAIFEPDETELSIGNAIAKGTVIGNDGADSIIALDQDSLEPGLLYRAIELPRAATQATIPVHLEIDDATLANNLRAAADRSVEGVRFVGADEFARFIVSSDRDRLYVSDAAGLHTVSEISLDSQRDAIDELCALLNRSRASLSLSQITNPSSNIRLTADIVGSTIENNMHVRRRDEPRSVQNSIMLEITVNVDSYLTLIDVDAEGSINVLFPNRYSRPDFLPDGYVSASTTTRIPDSLSSGNRAGFFWDYSPPAGLDTIQVFASTDLETASKIRSWIAALSAVETRSTSSPVSYSRSLTELQNQLVTDLHTRAIKVVQDQASNTAGIAADSSSAPTNRADWNSVALSIRITE